MIQFSLPIFENLCPGWNSVLHLGIKHTFQKGCQIYDLETPVNGVYLVVKGLVEIVLYTSQGPEKVLYYVGQGSIFGEVGCFVSGDTGEARIRARSDCETYFFSRDVIDGPIANHHSDLLIELIRSSAYKIRMFAVLLRDSLGGDNFQRVCKNLVYLVNYKLGSDANEKEKIVFEPGLTQSDLARLMGVHRVTLAKTINELRELGIVGKFTKSKLEIFQYSNLRKLATLVDQ